MRLFVRLLVVAVSMLVVPGVAGMLIGVLRSDLSLLGKALVVLLAAALFIFIVSTLLWTFMSSVTGKGYFQLLRAPRPNNPRELRLWWWAWAGWYSWIAGAGCLLAFMVAAKAGLL